MGVRQRREVQHEVWTPRSWKKKFIETKKEHEIQQSVEAEQDQGTDVVTIDDEFTRLRNYCERQMFQEGDERKCEGSEFV